MSTFDVKPESVEDAFKQVAKADPHELERNAELRTPPPMVGAEAAPVRHLVEQIMAHWVDADAGVLQALAEQTHEKLKKTVGEPANKDVAPKEGMAGDFKADSAGPAQQIDLPPKAGEDEQGGWGGGGGAGDSGAAGLGAEGGEGTALGEGGLPGVAAEVRGGGETVTYGGDGDGDDDAPAAPLPPEDPKKGHKG